MAMKSGVPQAAADLLGRVRAEPPPPDQPAEEAASQLEKAPARAQGRVENWDMRAASLWSLITAERFAVVEAALGSMITEVNHSGRARGLIATYSTLGLLKLRLGILP